MDGFSVDGSGSPLRGSALDAGQKARAPSVGGSLSGAEEGHRLDAAGFRPAFADLLAHRRQLSLVSH